MSKTMERCKFHLIRGDLQLDLEGPREFVEEQLSAWRDLLREAFGSKTAPDGAEGGIASTVPPTRTIAVRKNISIQEFFNLKKPRNDADRVLVTAYYLEKYEQMSPFDRQDIASFMGRVQSVPEHLDSFIQDNLRKGYITEAPHPEGDEKPFSLTYSGEMFVKGGLE